MDIELSFKSDFILERGFAAGGVILRKQPLRKATHKLYTKRSL